MQVQVMNHPMQSNVSQADAIIAHRATATSVRGDKWSVRRSVVFILLASLSLWAGIVSAILLR